MSKKSVLYIIKLIISIGLILFLLFKTDVESLLRAVSQIDISLFIIAVIIGSLTILIRSYKWQLLLDIQGAKLSLRYVVAITYMSLFFNNFAPGSIGGDVFKVHKTMKDSVFKSGAISSIIMERLTGLVMLFFMVLLFGTCDLFMAKPILEQNQFYLLIVYGLGILILAYVLYKVILRIKKLQLASKFPKIVQFIEDFKESINIHRIHKKIVISCLALSFIFFIINTIAMYLFALSANEKVNILQLGFAVPLIAFIALIPISVNGIGLQEGAFFLFFSKVGIKPESALLISFLPRIAILIFSLIGAVIYLFNIRIKKRSKQSSKLGDER